MCCLKPACDPLEQYLDDSDDQSFFAGVEQASQRGHREEAK